MAMGGGGGDKAVPYINVTPLIDVLLVLLIIFMVISPQKPSRFDARIPVRMCNQVCDNNVVFVGQNMGYG